MDLTVNNSITTLSKSPSFRGKIYACGLNEQQNYACQKVLTELKKIMRWRLYDLNIINNGTFINTINHENRVTNFFNFTKIQLQNKIIPDLIREKNISLSILEPEEITNTVKILLPCSLREQIYRLFHRIK